MSDSSTHPEPSVVDTDDPDGMRHWCDKFGITVEQLQESVLAAGSDPKAVEQHLLEQGSSAGAG